jgi:hypothetical protein
VCGNSLPLRLFSPIYDTKTGGRNFQRIAGTVRVEKLAGGTAVRHPGKKNPRMTGLKIGHYTEDLGGAGDGGVLNFFGETFRDDGKSAGGEGIDWRAGAARG